jgi:hypothetical protein
MIATAAVATLISVNGAFAQETAKGLLAIQVRSQGQVCDNPISATRDKKHSAPDVSVLGSSMREQFVQSSVGTRHGGAYTAP